MPIIVKAGGDFIPAPEGLQQAVCCDIVDMGMIDGQWGAKHMVQLRWLSSELNEKGEPFLIVKRYTCSLHKKSSLRPALEAWRGRAFTEDELRGFDLEKLLGINCQIQIVHEKKGDTTYANVQAIVPLGKGMGKLAVAPTYVRVKDRPVDGKPAEVDREPGEEPADDDDPVPF